MKKHVQQNLIFKLAIASALVIAIFYSLAFADIYQVGQSIKDFSLPDGLSGAKVTFNDNIKEKSKVIVLAFVTTTCSACKNEMTLLSGLAEKNENLKLYAICVDLNGSKTVPVYDKTFSFKAQYMLDPEFVTPQKFGFSFTPSLVIAKSDGEILYLRGGYSEESEEEIVETITDALK